MSLSRDLAVATDPMSRLTSIHELKALVLSFHPVIVVETVEEERIVSLMRAVAEQTKLDYFEWSVTRGLARPGGTFVAGTNEPFPMLKFLEALTVPSIFVLKDFSRYLDDPRVARQFRELADAFAVKRSTMVLSGGSIQLSTDLEHEAIRYELRLPDRDELLSVVTAVVESLSRGKIDESPMQDDSRQQLLRALSGLTLNQARQAVAHCILNDGKFTAEDISWVIDRKAQMIREGGLLEYYPEEDNRYELGGFANLKSWMQTAAVGFSKEARTLNLTPPRGILIVGVPGCGKSLAAKVIAREWKDPLLKLDAGRLFDKFIGESEKNFRAAIELGESMAPVVLWIDEIDKGMVASGAAEADGGLSRRLFGAFLTWLQEKREEVFVVATANDLTTLPPELLRKGRFDEVFFVDLPRLEEREAILRIHLRLHNQVITKFDLHAIATACDGFSGAEIEQAVIASLYRALQRKQSLDTNLLLEEVHLTIPLSVSRREDIERLREIAKRFVSVS
jgi:hypothetical protein